MKRTAKARLRHGALYGVLLAAVLALVFAADWESIQENFLSREVFADLWPALIFEAAKNTIVYTAVAFTGGLALALALALMKMSPIAVYRWLATVYIEFFRGLPALVVILAFAFAVPLAFNWRPPGGSMGSGCLALVVVSAAYMAETIRAGIQAVPTGQREAARSLGMSGTWTMISVVLPQAFRIVLPPLTNELVLLIKDTSLLQFIGVGVGQRELTAFASDKLTDWANATPLLAVAIVYLAITLPMTQLVARLERKQQRAR